MLAANLVNSLDVVIFYLSDITLEDTLTLHLPNVEANILCRIYLEVHQNILQLNFGK